MTDELLLKGVPASVGVATGAVVLLDDLEAGKITDTTIPMVVIGESIPPHVTTFASNIVGIVCDSGGPLCHGASLARELKIPAVVGAETATKQLKPGMLIKIDGRKGEIYAA